jgi:hypothetical protein
MDTINNTPVCRKNKHLNAFERGQIAALYNEGFSPYAIGKRLRRASNTIRNELKRGTVLQIKKEKKLKFIILIRDNLFMNAIVKIVVKNIES